MPIAAPQRFPNLQAMMDLFRSSINDDGAGQDGPQGGIIATNNAAFVLPFLNASIRYLYRKLRNIGDPALIVDNYILLGLPALAQADPTVQVSLGFLGYFDGFANHGNWTLPAGAMGVDRVWERTSGAGLDFVPVPEAPYGLPPCRQGNRMGAYEWRGNALWMPGCLTAVDLRLRSKIALPPILGNNLNFAQTYVPVLDADDAIVDRMLVLYARRFNPEALADAMAASKESMFELAVQVVRQAQRLNIQRADFGTEAVANLATIHSDL